MGMTTVLVGTGTDVGKTTVAEAWLREAGAGVRGWKPIESGGDADQRRLGEACGCRLEAADTLEHPVSPHRAARLAGRRLDLSSIVSQARAHASQCDMLVVETAGGLFSPLTDEGDTNAELAALLDPDRVVLVARDRLGVLHDVAACMRGAGAIGLRVDLVALTTTPEGPVFELENAKELERLHRLPVLAVEIPIRAGVGAELQRRLASR